MHSDRLLPGSLFGGMLLVAGCCIGAGMLALPILTGLSGFFPSLSMLFLSWAFMTFTGLLLVEANGWFYGQVNLLSMAEESLGQVGRLAAWISYLFLFYSLLVAYLAASGTVFSAVLEALFGFSLPGWFASIFFAALFGWIIYLGTRQVDIWNRILMTGLIVAYLGMIFLGVSRIDPKLLTHWSPKYLISSLSVLVISFGFQNLIPSLTAYMKGDLKRVRTTVLGGSLMALGVYLVWSLLVLGVVPYGQILESFQTGEEATIALRRVLGSSWISHFSQAFAFFAIVTSFLAQGLALAHFLADGLKIIPTRDKMPWLISLALLPPLIFALSFPQIFFKALSFAGGVCAMILFGILPTSMAWVGRYQKKLTSNYHVRGGKASLVLAFSFSLFVIFCELTRLFSR